MISLSKEADALARKLAAIDNLSVEDAVHRALQDRARAVGIVAQERRPRDRSPEAVAGRQARVDRIVAEIAAMPILDPRPVSEIVDDLNAL